MMYSVLVGAHANPIKTCYLAVKITRLIHSCISGLYNCYVFESLIHAMCSMPH